MIFSCEKNTLINGINTVSKALPAKSVNPICEGILFNVKNNSITLTATDNSLTIQTVIQAEVEEEGNVVLNGKFIAEIVRKMPDGIIKVSGNYNKGIEVTGNFSKLNISAFDSEEYPALPTVDKNNFFTVQQNELKKMINQTLFATAQDESRPILTGCLFEITKDKMVVVALDGYRLALKNSYIEDIDTPISSIIPARALSEISKILADTDDLVKIYIQKSYCMTEIDETKIITRLIEGEFINYKPIIPQSLPNNAIMDRIDLLEAIDRAWLIVRENTRNNHIILRFENNKLIITSRSDTGNAYEEVNFTGDADKIEIGFNPRYFVECLKNIEDEFIKFSYSTAQSPATIKPVDGDKYLYLILPVRL